ncbi:MAG: hypothetical protein IPK58_24315 [Acidobacteria bacterium]|nr:hypothetical protein [Acidobacteriota bacterium]
MRFVFQVRFLYAATGFFRFRVAVARFGLPDRALDILSSRRANIRLHQGLGLPTRHLENGDEFRTRLIINGQYGEPKNANYGHIKKLGAASDGEFNWLWRNSLDNYHRHSRVWHKWLHSVMEWLVEKRISLGSSWVSGFDIYDRLNDLDVACTEFPDEFKLRMEFARKCDLLASELSESVD